MPTNAITFQLTKTQEKVFNSILEDIYHLENALQMIRNKNLIPLLARTSIIFNYISLETLRNFYCEKLFIKKDQGTKNYKWKSFFTYSNHTEKINQVLKEKQYVDFKNAQDMETFVNELRIQRNLILHRTSLLNKKHNKKLIINLLNNIKNKDIKKIFTKSKNCIEIMNYIMELK